MCTASWGWMFVSEENWSFYHGENEIKLEIRYSFESRPFGQCFFFSVVVKYQIRLGACDLGLDNVVGRDRVPPPHPYSPKLKPRSSNKLPTSSLTLRSSSVRLLSTLPPQNKPQSVRSGNLSASSSRSARPDLDRHRQTQRRQRNSDLKI
ncbi:hypothetical protein PanWU01x14_216890 [Parasponia andersonii]|uniref:Uncharacterized protein n=1 Tax=Parasponia andersonii TaxID=3476 RepID=A0A2P5BRA9_PARAD|nr:hypothetical protein PanWU01x14_216890 [Parasponia andersonii]